MWKAMHEKFEDSQMIAPNSYRFAEARKNQIPETAGYGACTCCGCGSFFNDGTGDCRCGHSFGQHYS